MPRHTRNELKRLPENTIPMYRGIVVPHAQVEVTANIWDAEGYTIITVNVIGSANSYLLARRKND